MTSIDCFEAYFTYQAASVPTSLTTTGKLYFARAIDGVEVGWVGRKDEPHVATIRNARNRKMNLNDNGFELRKHIIENHVNYYDESEIVHRYLPEVSRFMEENIEGAVRVVPFDYNVRSSEVIANDNSK
jgi:hypothetical protein